jgi:PTS system nitrogen regulatory IIA component
MRLADVLGEDCVMPDLMAGGKYEVLKEMVNEASLRVKGLDGPDVMAALLERERLGTTGIGHGVAIPHGKVRGLSEIKVFFGRSRKGVDFSSMDSQPVHLVFLILTPEHSAAAHLKILACISRLLKNHDIRQMLLRAEGAREIYRIILDADTRNVMLYGH